MVFFLDQCGFDLMLLCNVIYLCRCLFMIHLWCCPLTVPLGYLYLRFSCSADFRNATVALLFHDKAVVLLSLDRVVVLFFHDTAVVLFFVDVAVVLLFIIQLQCCYFKYSYGVVLSSYSSGAVLL